MHGSFAMFHFGSLADLSWKDLILSTILAIGLHSNHLWAIVNKKNDQSLQNPARYSVVHKLRLFRPDARVVSARN